VSESLAEKFLENGNRMSDKIHSLKDLHEPIWFDSDLVAHTGNAVQLKWLREGWTYECKECKTLWPCRTMLVINGVELP